MLLHVLIACPVCALGDEGQGDSWRFFALGLIPVAIFIAAALLIRWGAKRF